MTHPSEIGFVFEAESLFGEADSLSCFSEDVMNFLLELKSAGYPVVVTSHADNFSPDAQNRAQQALDALDIGFYHIMPSYLTEGAASYYVTLVKNMETEPSKTLFVVSEEPQESMAPLTLHQCKLDPKNLTEAFQKNGRSITENPACGFDALKKTIDAFKLR